MPLLVIVAIFASLFALTAQAQTVPEALARRIKANPERFVDGAATLIFGFGGPDGLDAAGVERFIALERAGARASVLRRLLAADLDGDGAVAADEMQVAAGAASASQRGRMLGLLAGADADGDGAASGAEITDFAAAEALEAFDELRAQMARSVLGFDGNADGRVTLPEVRRAVDRLADAA
ncbi:MAG: hypothetical protein V4712_16055 [Pseudomonadota bacterium]